MEGINEHWLCNSSEFTTYGDELGLDYGIIEEEIEAFQRSKY